MSPMIKKLIVKALVPVAQRVMNVKVVGKTKYALHISFDKRFHDIVLHGAHRVAQEQRGYVAMFETTEGGKMIHIWYNDDRNVITLLGV